MQIKSQLGKLELKMSLVGLIHEQIETNQITILPIALEHILGLAELPDHHRDPFDRLLISQARLENLPILSIDTRINQYPVTVIW